MESILKRNFSIYLTRLIVLVSCIAFSSQALAQEFGSRDSRWVYNHDGYFGITRVEFEKDTLIDNMEFNKFSIVTTGIYVTIGDTMVRERQPIYLSNINGLVLYKIEDNDVDTLINFRAGPGDGWSIFDTFLNETFDITVIDTFRTDFNGQSLFSMSHLFRRRSIGSNRIDTTYEQIGNLHNFILPGDGWGISGGHGNIGGHIRCFTNNNLGLVEFEKRSWINPLADYFEFECDRIVGTVNPLDEEPLSIFPNPVSDELCLNRLEDNPIQVYNINGQLECSLVSKNENCYDVSHLQTGMYFLRTRNTVMRFVKVL